MRWAWDLTDIRFVVQIETNIGLSFALSDINLNLHNESNVRFGSVQQIYNVIDNFLSGSMDFIRASILVRCCTSQSVCWYLSDLHYAGPFQFFLDISVVLTSCRNRCFPSFHRHWSLRLIVIGKMGKGEQTLEKGVCHTTAKFTCKESDRLNMQMRGESDISG